MSKSSTSIFNQAQIDPPIGSGGGSGGMAIGGSVVGGTPYSFLYIDAFGNLSQDPQAARDSGVTKKTSVSSNCYAQDVVNSGGPGDYFIQADNINSNPTITWDGVNDTDTNIAAYNLANPSDTISVISGGTNIPDAGTVKLLGGTSTIQSGEFTGLSSIFGINLQGAGIFSTDTANNGVAFDFVGNIGPVGGKTAIGKLSGYLSASGVTSAIIQSPEQMQFIQTDGSSYNTQMTFMNGAWGAQSNETSMVLDGVNNTFTLGLLGTNLIIPLGQTPNVGDVLKINGIAGSDYTAVFQSGSAAAGDPGNIQFNNNGSFGGTNALSWDDLNVSFYARTRNFTVADDATGGKFLLTNSKGQTLGDIDGYYNNIYFKAAQDQNTAQIRALKQVTETGFAFTGSGLDDLTPDAALNYTGNSNNNSYTVTITHTDTQRIDFLGGFTGTLPTVGTVVTINGTITGTVYETDGSSYIYCDGLTGTVSLADTVTVASPSFVGSVSGTDYLVLSDRVDFVNGGDSLLNLSAVGGVQLQGIGFTFASATGHTIGDKWDWSEVVNYGDAFKYDYSSGVPRISFGDVDNLYGTSRAKIEVFPTLDQVKLTASTFSVSELSAYKDDSTAAAAGLNKGDLYQTDGSGAAPLNVAGIVMVKQ